MTFDHWDNSTGIPKPICQDCGRENADFGRVPGCSGFNLDVCYRNIVTTAAQLDAPPVVRRHWPAWYVRLIELGLIDDPEGDHP